MRRSTLFTTSHHLSSAALAIVVSGSLALTSCSGSDLGEDQAKEASTTAASASTYKATETTEASASENSSSKKPKPTLGGEAGSQGQRQGQGQGSSGGSGSGGASCGVNDDADAIYDNIHKVPGPNLEGTQWSYGGDSNYDPCADLSYPALDQVPKGNAQFARQIMLFHKGEYIGVGTLSVQHHIGIINTTNNSITVRYKDYEALDAAGAGHVDSPNYTADVTYRWDGQKVVPEDPIPNLKYYKE